MAKKIRNENSVFVFIVIWQGESDTSKIQEKKQSGCAGGRGLVIKSGPKLNTRDRFLPLMGYFSKKLYKKMLNVI